MGETTIEWTCSVVPNRLDKSIIPGYTFNGWIGCTKRGTGCLNCYAERDDRFRGWTEEGFGPGKPRKRTSVPYWKKPLQWNEQAATSGIRRKVFAFSLGDVFDQEVPKEWREDFIQLMFDTPHLDWLVLTKRIEYAARDYTAVTLPPNMSLGVSVCAQEDCQAITPLVAFRGMECFVSFEPLVELVNLDAWLSYGGLNNVKWLIVGGESGPNARPFHTEWAMEMILVARRYGRKVFVKQVGANPWSGGHPFEVKDRKGADPFEWPEEIRVREIPDHEGNLIGES